MTTHYSTQVEINWRELLVAVVAPPLQLADDESFLIENLPFWRELAALTARTPRRALANFLMLAAAIHLRKYLFDPRTPFSWRDCVSQVGEFQPAAKLFIDYAQDNISRHETWLYLNDLRSFAMSRYRAEVESTPVARRLSGLRLSVGYPQRLLDEISVSMPFENESINGSAYFATVTSFEKAARRFSLAELGKSLAPDDSLDFDVFSARIYYKSDENNIVIPLAALQAPRRTPNSETPRHLVAATLGVPFADELMNQLLIATSAVTTRRLLETSGCIAELYPRWLGVEYQATTDKEAESEAATRLAMALDIVFDDYSKWLREKTLKNEQALPSFQFLSSRQQFFVTAANMLCSADGASASGSGWARFSSSSPYAARIDAAFAALPEYAHEFLCDNAPATDNSLVLMSGGDVSAGSTESIPLAVPSLPPRFVNCVWV